MSTPVGNSAANASGNGPASGYSLKLWLFILFILICVISINMFTCFILLLKVIEILLVYTFNFGIKLCPKLPKYLTIIWIQISESPLYGRCDSSLINGHPSRSSKVRYFCYQPIIKKYVGSLY